MINVHLFIMESFLKRKNVKYKIVKAKTSNSVYVLFPIKGRNYVLRISDHSQRTLDYDFSLITDKDLKHVQDKITRILK